MARLDGKIAIITGATSGTRRRTAEIFTSEGARVVTCGRRQCGRACANRRYRDFGIAALAGAVILAGEILFPKAAWRCIEMAGERSLIFVSVALTPWLLGFIRYAYALARGEKRAARARLA
jgi:NAD(P)-dependent dehydrogenase (short-subunit alcohol dehydrogenase family)